MPHRRPKPSIVLGAVAALAVATPFAVSGLTNGTSDVRTANETTDAIAAIAPQIAEVVLANAPDVVVPLQDLTGLNLPDLSIKELVEGLPAITPAPKPGRTVSSSSVATRSDGADWIDDSGSATRYARLAST